MRKFCVYNPLDRAWSWLHGHWWSSSREMEVVRLVLLLLFVWLEGGEPPW